jgi:hypothetical protein
MVTIRVIKHADIDENYYIQNDATRTHKLQIWNPEIARQIVFLKIAYRI